MITKSIDLLAQRLSRPCSASHLDTAYIACGAGKLDSSKACSKVQLPLTPMELRKINLLTPALIACSANINVPSTLTFRNSTKGSLLISDKTCARAAK